MVKAFGLASAHDGGVDVIITGDSPAEQRAYYSWSPRLSRGLGLSRRRTPVSPGFQRMLEMLNGISRAYFADIHGADALDPAVHGVPSQVGDRLRFFSIYDDTNYDSGSHWKFLTGFLGFVFDDIAFSFSESDCGNPGLMAHLRGLRAEHRQGRNYAKGVDEYVSFAVGLMHRKDFPGELIDMMRACYAGTEGIIRMREMMGRYAEETYDLSEEQLVCMVWSPFIGNGLTLTEFLEAEHSELAQVFHAE